MNEIDRIEEEFQVIGVDPDALRKGGQAGGELLSAAFGLAADREQGKRDAVKAKEQEAKAAQARAARLEATIAASKAAAEPGNAALQEASLRADAKARELEMAAGQTPGLSLSTGPSVSSGSWFSKMSGPLSNGAWLGIGLGGATIIGLGIYFSKRK